jgi:hypothetical protein
MGVKNIVIFIKTLNLITGYACFDQESALSSSACWQ